MHTALRRVILSLAIPAMGLSVAHAQSTADFGYTLVYGFTGGTTPSEPIGILQGPNGNFYAPLSDPGGNATEGGFVELTPAGVPTILASFCDSGCTAADGPIGAAVLGNDGNFYGAASSINGSDFGTIYQVTPAGASKPIFTLCQGSTESCQYGFLSNALALGTDGALYGITSSGGANGGGVLFRVTTAGVFTSLISMPAGNYYGTLLQASDGNWYGTAASGGANGGGYVFQYTTAGKLNVIYSFCAKKSGSICLDGQSPYGGLVEGANSLLYGTTSNGGSGQVNSYQSEAGGTLFSMTTGGKLTTLYNFCTDPSGNICNDGNSPYSAPYIGSDGNLYGVAADGGAGTQGVGYQYILSSNTYAITHTFCTNGCTPADLVQPESQLLQANDGTYWGSSAYYCSGNTCSGGGFFQLTDLKGQASPVELTPSANISAGSTFTITYAVNNAYSEGLQECLATNSAGDTTWAGVLKATTSNQTITLTAPKTPAVYTYALTCGAGREMNYLSLDVKNSNMIATTTTFSASPNPAATGSEVTLRATVTPASGTGHPSGNVSFYYGSTLLGEAGLNNNVATLTGSSSGFPDGTYALTAKYPGDEEYSASSGNTNFTLAPPTTTTLSITPTSVTPPGDVTISIAVKKVSGTGTPTGTVTLSADGVSLGTVSLSSGSVSFSYSSKGIAAGTYPVIATYNGDSGDAQSVSNTVSVVVK